MLPRDAVQRPSAPAYEATTHCTGIRSNDPLLPMRAGAPCSPHAKQRPLPRDGERTLIWGGTQRPSGSVGVGVPWSRGLHCSRCGARHRRRKGVLEALSRQPGEFPISRQPAAPSLRGHGNSAPGSRAAQVTPGSRPAARWLADQHSTHSLLCPRRFEPGARGPSATRPLRSVGRSVARVARVARSPAVRRTPCRPRRRSPAVRRTPVSPASPGRPAVRRTPVSPASPGRPRSVERPCRPRRPVARGQSVTASAAVRRSPRPLRSVGSSAGEDQLTHAGRVGLSAHRLHDVSDDRPGGLDLPVPESLRRRPGWPPTRRPRPPPGPSRHRPAAARASPQPPMARPRRRDAPSTCRAIASLSRPRRPGRERRDLRR